MVCNNSKLLQGSWSSVYGQYLTLWPLQVMPTNREKIPGFMVMFGGEDVNYPLITWNAYPFHHCSPFGAIEAVNTNTKTLVKRRLIANWFDQHQFRSHRQWPANGKWKLLNEYYHQTERESSRGLMWCVHLCCACTRTFSNKKASNFVENILIYYISYT